MLFIFSIYLIVSIYLNMLIYNKGMIIYIYTYSYIYYIYWLSRYYSQLNTCNNYVLLHRINVGEYKFLF